MKKIILFVALFGLMSSVNFCSSNRAKAANEVVRDSWQSSYDNDCLKGECLTSIALESEE